MKPLFDPLRFSIAVTIAALPQLSVAYVYAAAPLQFIVLLVLWNLAPLVVAVVLFIAGARYPAWGWLTAVALFGFWSVAAIFHSERSTAAMGFMWAPVWSFIIVGPVGAGVAILVKKAQTQSSRIKHQGGKQ